LRLANGNQHSEVQLANGTTSTIFIQKIMANSFFKTSSFFVFCTKKPWVNMLMKLTPGQAKAIGQMTSQLNLP